MQRWNRRWAAWMFSAVASFAWLETAALIERSRGAQGATLSAALRRWLGVEPRTQRKLFMGAGFAAFWTWFCLHILRG